MRRLEIAGTYGEALPSGAYAVLAQHAIQTHLGPIGLHNGTQPLYLRIADVPLFQMVGQAHDSGCVLHYVADKGWTLRADISHGQSGHIFDKQGVLHVINPGPDVTSQGYRYVNENGALISGDSTYRHPVMNVYEWTQCGDVVIGQGSQGGCVAVHMQFANGVRLRDDRRVLEPGDCRFVRFNRAGNALAVTIVKLPERKTVLLWLDVSELSSFPAEKLVPNPGPTVPNPGTPPQPKPMPEEPASLLFTVGVVREKYPQPSQADLGAMLNEIAWLHRADGWGLSRKTSGNYTTQPRTGERIGVDVLHHKPSDTLWDVFLDAGGRTEPTWGKAHPHNDPSRIWIAPVEPLTLPDSPDLPTPDNPPSACNCAAELAAIKVELQHVRALTEANSQDCDTLMEWRERIKSGSWKVKGNTSRAWGHSHQIELTVEPEK